MELSFSLSRRVLLSREVAECQFCKLEVAECICTILLYLHKYSRALGKICKAYRIRLAGLFFYIIPIIIIIKIDRSSSKHNSCYTQKSFRPFVCSKSWNNWNILAEALFIRGYFSKRPLKMPYWRIVQLHQAIPRIAKHSQTNTH